MQQKSSKSITIHEMLRLKPQLYQFSLVHNNLKEDVNKLLEKLINSQSNLPEFQSYFRSTLVSFFSLIEGDLYSYNQFDPYPEYRDISEFYTKFKQTFRQICKTWDKGDLYEVYSNQHISQIKYWHGIRNKLAHPKVLADIYNAQLSDLNTLENEVSAYNKLISDIMSNFFFEFKVSKDEISLLDELFKGATFIPK